MAKPKLSEHAIQSQILNWLALKGIFHYRQNSGGFKKGKHFVKFGAKGAPDIVAVDDGKYVGIEVKRKDGRMSEDQKQFAYCLTVAGGIYILAYSLNDVIEELG